MDRSQKSEVRSQNPDKPNITKDEWVDLSRKLLERAWAGFSRDERATIAGFINYVAHDVETIQIPYSAPLHNYTRMKPLRNSASRRK